MDRSLTVPEAAELLGYHVDHVRRLLKAGKLEGERVGGRWLIAPQEVERIQGLQGPGGRLPKGIGNE